MWPNNRSLFHCGGSPQGIVDQRDVLTGLGMAVVLGMLVVLALEVMNRPTMYVSAITGRCLAVVDEDDRLIAATAEGSCQRAPRSHFTVVADEAVVRHLQPPPH